MTTAWDMKATNQPTWVKSQRREFERKSWETYDGKDGGEEKEVVGQNWGEVKAFISSRRHGWYRYIVKERLWGELRMPVACGYANEIDSDEKPRQYFSGCTGAQPVTRPARPLPPVSSTHDVPLCVLFFLLGLDLKLHVLLLRAALHLANTGICLRSDAYALRQRAFDRPPIHPGPPAIRSPQ